ncbi:DUF6306 domain-containing protein [Pseudomonas putida]|uniref:DUF6306 domain-containing protein n=1 Tax=Pseudomonas putida TaxID=303 RepID=UPI002DB9F116|nr:DUF6306 domain-containing protein [Pseudomonas putida]WRW04769.1 DUF6306 domain-containing protein [Pseudomonas putida]
MTDSPSEHSEKKSEDFSVEGNHLTQSLQIPTPKPSEQKVAPTGSPESLEPIAKGPHKCRPSDGIEDGNDLIAWLQMLLEAEHAGALIMVDSLKEARSEALIRQLETLHFSEAASCQRLRRSLKRLGAVPSKKVSEFHAKTMIISDMDERLMFIARGQRWVAKRIEERLPSISQRWLYEELKAVLTLHT